MEKYLSTCIAGLEAKAAQWISAAGARIISTGEGYVYYSLEKPVWQKWRFFSNTYLALMHFDNPGIGHILRRAGEKADEWLPSAAAAARRMGAKSFKLEYSEKGRLRTMPDSARAYIERRIAMGCSLRYGTKKPDLRFLFYSRTGDGESEGFFLLRLTNHPAYDKELQKGELRPDICDAMVRLAGLDKNVIWDPFCGSGAIPLARAQYAFKAIYASDYESAVLQGAKDKLSGHRDVFVFKANATKPVDFEPQAIITDPPWGAYDGKSVAGLYRDFLRNAFDVLPGRGVLVVLTGAENEWNGAFRELRDKLSDEVIPLTYSGRKCALHVVKRK